MSASLAAIDRRAAALLLFAAATILVPRWAGAAEPPEGPPLYQLAEPGSYELPVIDRVASHQLLNEAGERVPLLDLQGGKLAIVSFVYASCPDAGGCPLVLASLRRLDREIASNRDLARRVELVTVSFDPARDTPERMTSLRDHLRPTVEWRFLTAPSDREIRPVLDDFGQDALRLVSVEDGASLGVIRHVAKVFLVDSDLAIRNIYSSGFLDYAILLRDIETLLLEQRMTSSSD